MSNLIKSEYLDFMPGNLIDKLKRHFKNNSVLFQEHRVYIQLSNEDYTKEFCLDLVKSMLTLNYATKVEKSQTANPEHSSHSKSSAVKEKNSSIFQKCSRYTPTIFRPSSFSLKDNSILEKDNQISRAAILCLSEKIANDLENNGKVEHRIMYKGKEVNYFTLNQCDTKGIHKSQLRSLFFQMAENKILHGFDGHFILLGHNKNYKIRLFSNGGRKERAFIDAENHTCSFLIKHR